MVDGGRVSRRRPVDGAQLISMPTSFAHVEMLMKPPNQNGSQRASKSRPPPSVPASNWHFSFASSEIPNRIGQHFKWGEASRRLVDVINWIVLLVLTGQQSRSCVCLAADPSTLLILNRFLAFHLSISFSYWLPLSIYTVSILWKRCRKWIGKRRGFYMIRSIKNRLARDDSCCCRLNSFLFFSHSSKWMSDSWRRDPVTHNSLFNSTGSADWLTRVIHL